MSDSLNLTSREHRIIMVIYEYLEKNRAVEAISDTELKQSIASEIPSGFLQPLMLRLIDKNLITRSYSAGRSSSEDGYGITFHGLAVAEDFSGQTGFDLSAEKWEPLPVEWDDKSLDQSITAVEAVLDRVKGDNGFAVSDPVAHRRIVWSLSSALQALKEKLPSRSQIRELLLKPLNWLSESFAKTAVGELAKEAVKTVTRHLGFSP